MQIINIIILFSKELQVITKKIVISIDRHKHHWIERILLNAYWSIDLYISDDEYFENKLLWFDDWLFIVNIINNYIYILNYEFHWFQ